MGAAINLAEGQQYVAAGFSLIKYFEYSFSSTGGGPCFTKVVSQGRAYGMHTEKGKTAAGPGMTGPNVITAQKKADMTVADTFNQRDWLIHGAVKKKHCGKCNL